MDQRAQKQTESIWAAASRIAKGRLRWLKDLQGRWRVQRRPRDPQRPVLVCAATFEFPQYAHTFVQQEMCGLVEAGFDVQVLCWRRASRSQLAESFAGLYGRCHEMQLVPFLYQRDMEHFRRSRPGRLEAFLERLAVLTGRTVAELEAHPTVQQGCSFARWVEDLKADYIHSYFFYEMSLMAWMAAWLLEIPRGLTCYADHMLDDHEFKLVAAQLEAVDLLVATSRRIAAELSDLGGEAVADKILVKPNGVDGRRFGVAAASPGTADLQLISVCRIEPKKGLDVLLDALAHCRDRGLKLRLQLIGAADPQAPGSEACHRSLRAQVQALELGDQVDWLGFQTQEQIASRLQQTQIFVAPYVEIEGGDKDGIPTALLEAMASGRTLICSDAGSLGEVIRDGVEGRVVPQGDPQALAAVLQELAADPGHCQQLGAAARVRFAAEFDAAVTEAQLHTRLRQLLDDQPR